MSDVQAPFEGDATYLADALSHFSEDKFVFDTIGMEFVAAREGQSFVSMPAGPHVQNAKGGVQGGALFTLADIAVALADYSSDEVNATVDGSIQYLAVPQGQYVYAHAFATRRGRSMGYYRVDLTDEEGRLVAVGSFTYLHRPREN